MSNGQIFKTKTICTVCGYRYRMPNEMRGICCSNSEIKTVPWTKADYEYQDLIDSASRRFREIAIKINSSKENKIGK